MRQGTDRAAQSGSRRRGLEVLSPRGDEGVTLIELLVAIVVILVILIPTAVFIIQAQKAVSAEHLRAEAINVATRQLETLQLEAAQGTLPTGTSTVTYPVAEAGSRVTKFKVDTSWSVVTQGTNQSICATNAAVAQQIWVVTAIVTWPKMNGAQPVIQTTEIAPAQAGAVQQFAGEVAVRLTVDGTNPFLADAVTATMTGQWTGSGTGPTPPSGTFTTETATTASTSSGYDGCIVFQNLDAYSDSNGLWDYTLSFAGNTSPPLVAGDEQADSNPGGALTVNIGSLEPGVPQPETVEIDAGTPLTIGYTGPGGSCTTAPGSTLSPPVSPSAIPISVQNSFLTTYENKTWVAYGSTPFSSLLLFPWSGVTTLWTGDQPNSAVSAYPYAALSVSPSSGTVGTTGVTLSGTGYTATKTVNVTTGVTFGGNPLTISGTQTVASDGTWSATFAVPSSSNGSQTITATDSGGVSASASFSVNAPYAPSSLRPCGVDATTGNSTSIYLPVYPLYLTVNGSASTMTAKEVAGGGYAMALIFASHTSATSLPLGEYLLSHDGGGTVTPAYVWVTPAGECSATTAPTASTVPPAQSACKAAFLTVTAS